MGTSSTVALELVLKARDDAAAALKSLDDALEDVGDSAEETQKKADGLEDVMKDLKKAITAAAIVEAGKATYELGRMGAESLRAGNRFEALSGGADEAEENLRLMEEATRNAVDEMTLMVQGGRLLQTGLVTNGEEMANLAAMAVTLGDATQDAGGRIEDFSLMLLNQSFEVMDKYGMSAGQARERVLELQASIEGLSREEAFKIAVLEQGEAAMARLGDTAEDDLLAFEQLETEVENLTMAYKEDLAPAVADVVRAMTLQLQWNERLGDTVTEHGKEVEATAETYEDYRAELIRAAEAAGHGVDAAGNLMLVNQELYGTMTHVVEEGYLMGEALWNVTQRAAEGAAYLEGWAGKSWDVVEATEELTGSTQRAAHAFHDELNEMSRAAYEASRFAEQAAMMEEKLDILRLAMAGPVSETNERFAEEQAELRDRARELVRQITALEGKSYLTAEQQGQLEDWKGQLDGVKTKMAEVAAEHEQAMKGIVFDIMSAQIEDQNWGAAGAQLQIDIAEKLGLIDEATWRMASGMNEALDSFDTAPTIEEMDAIIDKTVDIGLGMEDIPVLANAALDKVNSDIAVEQISALIDEEDRVRQVAEEATTDMQQSFDRVSVQTAVEEVGTLEEALAEIPRQVTIDVVINQHGNIPQQQHGGYHQGGLTWVGEGGPELVALPAGSRVYSNQEARSMTIDQSRNVRQGDTVVIRDLAAMAMYLESRREENMRRLRRNL